MEILIRREFPANKPKKEGYYHTENDFLYWKKGNWYIGHGFSSPKYYTPSYFYEPITIDGAEELDEKLNNIWLHATRGFHHLPNNLERRKDAIEMIKELIFSSRVEENPLSFEEFIKWQYPMETDETIKNMPLKHNRTYETLLSLYEGYLIGLNFKPTTK